MDAPVEVVTRISVEDMKVILAAARTGDFTPATKARENLFRHRATVLNEMGRVDTAANPVVRRAILQELLVESRNAQQDLDDRIRQVMDEQHATRMADLADASNTIAAQAQVTGDALKFWTIVLALATVVLAVATVALIFATLAA